MNTGCAGKTVRYIGNMCHIWATYKSRFTFALPLIQSDCWHTASYKCLHCIEMLCTGISNMPYWSWTTWLDYAAYLVINAGNFCKYCENWNINLRLCDVSSRAFWSEASPSHGFSFNFSRQDVCFFKLPVTTLTVNSAVGSKKQFNAPYHVKINTGWLLIMTSC